MSMRPGSARSWACRPLTPPAESRRQARFAGTVQVGRHRSCADVQPVRHCSSREALQATEAQDPFGIPFTVVRLVCCRLSVLPHGKSRGAIAQTAPPRSARRRVPRRCPGFCDNRAIRCGSATRLDPADGPDDRVDDVSRFGDAGIGRIVGVGESGLQPGRPVAARTVSIRLTIGPLPSHSTNKSPVAGNRRETSTANRMVLHRLVLRRDLRQRSVIPQRLQ